jgi:uncharacterized RDD family membrane protein YckC
MVDIQKASLMKRFAAWMIDAILVGIIAIGIGFLLSLVLNYDKYNDTLTAGYEHYETQYGVVLNITPEEYQAMSEEDRLNYDQAYAAFSSDEELVYAYNMSVSLILIMTSVSLLVGTVLVEFVVPLLLKNGQTVGKKVFSLALIRTDGIKLSALQLFVRSVLGKFTVETMIPIYVLMMIMWGAMGIVGLIVLAGLLIVQAVLVIATDNDSMLHDVIACTVVVDYLSQRIFDNTDDLIEYTKRIHAEQASRQDY